MLSSNDVLFQLSHRVTSKRCTVTAGGSDHAIICVSVDVVTFSAFHFRPPALQLYLRPDRRDVIRGVVAGRPFLLGAAAAAAGHRLRVSAARGVDPQLQSQTPQSGRSGSERTRRR